MEENGPLFSVFVRCPQTAVYSLPLSYFEVLIDWLATNRKNQ
jgi:hypothetical protein